MNEAPSLKSRLAAFARQLHERGSIRFPDLDALEATLKEADDVSRLAILIRDYRQLSSDLADVVVDPWWAKP